jgi:hypothetical protein
MLWLCPVWMYPGCPRRYLYDPLWRGSMCYLTTRDQLGTPPTLNFICGGVVLSVPNNSSVHVNIPVNIRWRSKRDVTHDLSTLLRPRHGDTRALSVDPSQGG